MAQLVVKERKRISGHIGQYGTLLAILGLIAVFTVTNDQFLTYANFSDIIKSVSIVSLLALGVTFSLIVGGFDLSVGSTASLATIGAAASLVLHRQELLVALLIPLALGILVGLLNALVTIKFRLPDLLATLAIMYVINGIQLTYTKGFSIYDNMPIEGGTAPGRFIPSFLFIGQGTIGPIPFVALLMLVFFIGAHLFLTYTRTGREFYYVGSNAEAARRSGIAVNRIKLYAYVLSGLFAAIGGIILASRIGTGQVSAGAPLLMDAVAAAYIGYAVFGTGRPNVIGTLIGAILIGILLNGLTMWDVPYYAQDIVKGTILIGALGLSYIQKKQRT
ncbi:ABC transporter permease [Exiguobacterium profundum]|uniref:Inner-membrane translocator n=2 Tax=Exiguobacterium TaxID=33986 RepID=C4KZ45_EXISA|nr:MULTISPECIES: ABC transporter permease [Exiguobacterium]QPI68017.1 ABC transporter permease [Exiguobacterium sp. PBE]ACQ70358.1 inner-membrane translocator [Exiguobacterium sp. AT1b]MBG0918156.1 ABC transporter permease [Exiguobacterium sp. SRB7LM]MCV9900444.1 ABC transporter permease [Exiguobacterium sp. N5]MDT0192690.1 ABC transporter permease [Exiguobacterium sp. BG5(2022)]